MCGCAGSRRRAGWRGGCPHRGTSRRHARGQGPGRLSRDWPRERVAAPPGCGRLGIEHRDGMEVERTLDVRAGVLHHRVRDGRRELEAVTFCSLARPGTVVVRVASSDGRLRPGAALHVPAPADAGSRSGGVSADGQLAGQAPSTSWTTSATARLASSSCLVRRAARPSQRTRGATTACSTASLPTSSTHGGCRTPSVPASSSSKRSDRVSPRCSPSSATRGGGDGRAATSSSTAIRTCSSRCAWRCSI